MEIASAKPDSRLRLALGNLALFVLLAVVHTWPLATAPGRHSRNDTSDTLHHEWILAWGAHQLAADPLHFFDANNFYPERDTLAYSDHLVVQAVMGAPLFWAGASPVLAYNLVLMAGLVLTGWTTSLVVGHWTGNRIAGVLSGSLMAFNALTLTRFAEIQDQHLEFFPLSLWALDRLLNDPRIKYAAQLTGWFVIQALTCGYLLVFTSVSLVTAVLVRPADWIGPRFRRTAGLLLLSAAGAALALMPFMLPYLRVSRAHGFTRPLAVVALYSARFTDYLATGGRLHFNLWSHRFFERDALFPGFIAAALVVVAVLTGVAWRDRRARMAVAFGLVTFALSFGPAFPLYGPLTKVLPIMIGVRGAGRFGQLVLAAVAILAGFGLAVLYPRFKRHAAAVAVLLVIGVNLEALRAPLHYRDFRGISPIFDRLAASQHEVIACLPFPQPRVVFENVDCMLVSTRFWHPLVNGYSSFMPERYNRDAAALESFPDSNSIRYLRQRGVTKLIVFLDRMSPTRLAGLAEHPELTLWAADKSVRIYALEREARSPEHQQRR